MPKSTQKKVTQKIIQVSRGQARQLWSKKAVLEDLVFPSVTVRKDPQRWMWLAPTRSSDQEKQNTQHRQTFTSKGINLNTSVLVIYKNDSNIYSTKPKKTYDPYLLSLKVFVLYSFMCFTESTLNFTAIICFLYLKLMIICNKNNKAIIT